MQLRPYQDELIENIFNKINNNVHRICVMAPTGAGKSVIIAKIVQMFVSNLKRVFLVAHRKELLDQLSDTLTNFNINHAMISPDYPSQDDINVQVCSVDSLIKRFNKYKKPDLIIIDECHHVADNKWGKVLNYYSESVSLGFTATPIKSSGEGLGRFYDLLIEAPSVEWLTDNKFLCPIRYFVPPQIVDLSGLRTVGGDYVASELEERLDKSIITGDAIKHYARICPRSPAIAFCASIRHAQSVAAEFSANGFASEVIHGGLNKVTRKLLLKALASGEIHVLTSVDVISEGTDVPHVVAAIDLCPTRSLVKHKQKMGRITRNAKNKIFAFFFDHVGNVLRNGFADTPIKWSLEGNKKSRKKSEPTPQIKQCPICYCAHKPAPTCPTCGHTYKSEIRKLKTEHGELTELTKQERALIQIKLKKEVQNANTLDKLLQIQQQRKYSNGWAERVFEGKRKAREKYKNQYWKENKTKNYYL
ncbi:DEAD/DEAH box helicase [Silvanigrella sp.]|uniref:DEAD/DEAH box helicase n=1 Tax=Silvanigrella sp. TaxID=2024976 RepID=UPI0037CAA771